MGYGLMRGNGGGQYGYFFCLGRHSGRTKCDQRYLPEQRVQDAVVRFWAREQLPVADVAVLREQLLEYFDQHAELSRAEKTGLAARAADIRRQRVLWAEKAMDGVVPDDIARDEQSQLAQTLGHIDMQIAQLAQLGDLQRESLEAALRLVTDCGTAYEEGDEALRRAYKQSGSSTSKSTRETRYRSQTSAAGFRRGPAHRSSKY
jgi:site-specific DNA recombinase